MATTIAKISWGGWPNCYRISNGEIEAILTADVGPRILSFGFCGGQNMFYVRQADLGGSGEPDFKLRGGHRIWAAPEEVPRTYHPDNALVQIHVAGSVITATAPIEAGTGLRKEIEFHMAGVGARASVTHRITNLLAWDIELSPWALTMMAAGGTAITGFPPRGTHPEVLAPTNPLVMWAFTDLSDPRWTITKKYLVLRQDPANATPMKVGHFNPDTWGAYLLGSDLFLKRYTADASLRYPDYGCSYETFTNDFTLELETLGPLTRLKPGATIEHVERWSMHKGVVISGFDDKTLDTILEPILG